MSDKYPGGFVTLTTPTGANAFDPALGAAAPGVWTLDQALHYTQNRLWPIYDPYFNQTTLLLHGNGTNGAGNKTFLDSSPNNFTITRNGNTTQGTFTPTRFSSGWSNTFNTLGVGSVQQITTSDFVADFNFSSGDFTIECFFNPAFLYTPSNPGTSILFPQNSLQVRFTDGNVIFMNGAGTNLATAVAHGMSIGVWYHWAFVRSGTTYYVFRNGVQITSGSGGTIANAADFFAVGANDLIGSVSNVRVTKGQALYTSTFTPSTTPLTTTSQNAIAANVKLLTCQSNRFVDNSTQNPKTIYLGLNAANSPQGTRFATPFSPFPPLAPYTPYNTGGSGYFDGTGDYLTFPSNAALSFDTGDYTVEAWVYFTAISSADLQIIFRSGGGGNNFYFHADGNQLSVGTGGAFISVQATTFLTNTWYHVAACRSAGTLRLFSNGVQVGSSVTDSTTWVSTGTAGVGSNETGIQLFSGYISSLRVVKGTAVYTAAFTPPTAPVTAITNTSLLCNFTNAGIIDSAMDTVLETLGNAQISTTQSKFGGTSIRFDGAADYLDLPNSLNAQFGTGDFTIEGWVYTTLYTVTQVLFDFRATNGATYGQIYISPTLVLRFSLPTDVGTSNTILLATWAHFAVTRASGTLNMYINGVRGYTGTHTSAMDATKIRIGSNVSGGDTFSGYLEDVRITKGFARYTTASFTPPTSQFQDQ